MSSISVENYLKAIFKLEQRLESDDDRVKSKDIATVLDIAQPSVTSMLKSLSGQKLLDYVPYQGVRMTPAGRHAALQVIRRHRLVEVFLIDSLGLSWDEVHEEAEALEHAMSEKVTNRLEEFLGFPTHDPHGDPIPSRDGILPAVEGRPLALCEPPMGFLVARVLDQSPDFLRYIEELGLTPGSTGLLVNVEPFEGPMELEIEGEARHISRALARRVVVEVVEDGV